MELTQETDYEPAVGQIFQSNRGKPEAYQLLYVDSQIALLRSEQTRRNTSDNNHRMMTRAALEKYVDSGQLEYRPDAEMSLMGENDIDWTEVSHVGEKGCENLYDAGFRTALDVVTADKDEILAVNSIGAAAASNIREYVT